MADTISAVKELTHENDSKVTVQSPIRKDNTVCNFRDFVEFSSETLDDDTGSPRIRLEYESKNNPITYLYRACVLWRPF